MHIKYVKMNQVAKEYNCPSVKEVLSSVAEWWSNIFPSVTVK